MPGDVDQAVPVPLGELNDLYAKLETQPAIEQAKGVIMGYYGLSPETAFLVLRRWSQDSNVKLRVLAQRLVDAVANHPHGGAVPHELISNLRLAPPHHVTSSPTAGRAIRPA